jgi:hypothetical protein
MNIEFTGNMWYWHGPAPWYFVTVPAQECHDLHAIVGFVTYGWGMIPVRVWLGNSEWTTSLFPKDGRYLVPIKASVRNAEQLEEGDHVTVQLEVRQ